MEKKRKKNGKFSKEKILTKIQSIKKDQLVIGLMVGLLLVIIAIPTKSSSPASTEDTTEKPSVLTELQADSIESQFESRLAEILCNVQGVGNVSVMLTINSKGETIVEKDVSKTEKTSLETDSTGGTRNTTEIASDEVTVYLEDENGKQVPYVIKELEPTVEGVIVIAEGGDDPIVVKEISEAIMALFSVQAHKIKVMKME